MRDKRRDEIKDEIVSIMIYFGLGSSHGWDICC